MFGFRKARAALRLHEANRAFAKARADRLRAEIRRDTRAMHATGAALRKARTEQVAAELNYAAVTSKPLHA